MEVAVPYSAFQPGTRVEVRSRFDAAWASGFEVATHAAEGYRLRRVSDGALLPVAFSDDDVRDERRGHRRGTWWVP